jgi:hypothetical protein
MDDEGAFTAAQLFLLAIQPNLTEFVVSVQAECKGPDPMFLPPNLTLEEGTEEDADPASACKRSVFLCAVASDSRAGKVQQGSNEEIDWSGGRGHLVTLTVEGWPNSGFPQEVLWVTKDHIFVFESKNLHLHKKKAAYVEDTFLGKSVGHAMLTPRQKLPTLLHVSHTGLLTVHRFCGLNPANEDVFPDSKLFTSLLPPLLPVEPLLPMPMPTPPVTTRPAGQESLDELAKMLGGPDNAKMVDKTRTALARLATKQQEADERLANKLAKANGKGLPSVRELIAVFQGEEKVGVCRNKNREATLSISKCKEHRERLQNGFRTERSVANNLLRIEAQRNSLDHLQQWLETRKSVSCAHLNQIAFRTDVSNVMRNCLSALQDIRKKNSAANETVAQLAKKLQEAQS